MPRHEQAAGWDISYELREPMALQVRTRERVISTRIPMNWTHTGGASKTHQKISMLRCPNYWTDAAWMCGGMGQQARDG